MLQIGLTIDPIGTKSAYLLCTSGLQSAPIISQ